MTSEKKHIQVAVAVIKREDGKVLFAERPVGTDCAGEWEFPGGKIEPKETARQALNREIEEELAIIITEARPWITLSHHYPHARVLLHFFIVTGWTGKEHAQEGQQLAWQDLSNLSISPLLAANAPVIRALQLPNIYAISRISQFGEEDFLVRLKKAVDNGLGLIQIRENAFNNCQLQKLIDKVLSITVPAGVSLLINSGMPAQQIKRFSGLHLNSGDLMELKQRPDFELVAASCHDRKEMDQAAKLGLDFIVLSPIKHTLSHPDTIPLGIEKMAELIADYPIPVYGLGGMSKDQLHEIQSFGAHGIAMMRGAWC